MNEKNDILFYKNLYFNFKSKQSAGRGVDSRPLDFQRFEGLLFYIVLRTILVT